MFSIKSTRCLVILPRCRAESVKKCMVKTHLPYLNILSLSPYGKSIPYAGSGVPQKDGQANYGFKNLKAKPALVDTIPELLSDSALKNLVRSLNLESSHFFSVGCFSTSAQTERGHRHRGHLKVGLWYWPQVPWGARPLLRAKRSFWAAG